MNKIEFCKQLVQTVDNCRELGGMSEDDIAKALSCLMSPLQPKDKKKFASWGMPWQQTTEDKCW